MTNKANEFFNAFEKMFAETPVDYNAWIKNAAEYNSKLSKIALETAKKNAELSQVWAKDTLSKMDVLTKIQDEPADYAKMSADFVSAQTQSAPEHIAALADVAKKAQVETVELMLAAGKQLQTEVAEVAKTATASAE
jgi:hypothetical protein